ncbi:hydantoinase/oxoprolinase family protein [Acuticoccus mangrovi]|uniref:Hydantoinase/oxoprolinase family protein n=1 Tax=Acuticoccus mangrovi TaxID=2796142 RepID=A0A934MHG4_9HYPH|nr:hydantoinase/oxoprolinase family protein [Acuticoccus mangrovi]MBJ3776920.1 hydantoinase/oxoprolinase family protein [Acuticoccus mangrovi]
MTTKARIGVDIGGTFTDGVLELDGRQISLKVLTTHDAPERGLREAIDRLVEEAGLAPSDIGLIVHGTTLATNALIERKGARTALITTEGFRDILEIRGEDRYDHHAIGLRLPEPLVPRSRRHVLVERVSAAGEVLRPLDRDAVEALVPRLVDDGVEAVAVGFLHSYRNDAHEQLVREVLDRRLPGVPVSLSSEVSPEMREYERFSTTCANAYVQPLMMGYLGRLQEGLAAASYDCQLLMMLSSGGLTTVDMSARFPVRLVESGPAGGALFARSVAERAGLAKVLSFDMGGTTAKICMIENGEPQTAHSFEVARIYRFKKGSGLPLRIPVIELVEIGAGGGSIARVDAMGRITVGPDSAGSEPGPACYGRGGTDATVTDADVVLGAIAPEGFAAGTIPVDRAACEAAVADNIGSRLGLDIPMAAYGIREIVDENMTAAARVHAIECGMDASARTMIAFGGAAPLHAGRIAEKLKLDRFIVPVRAGVGSAVGFLLAPLGYEIVRSLHQRLDRMDFDLVGATLGQMEAEARAVVRSAGGGLDDAALTTQRIIHMRYLGQGHQIAVTLPDGPIVAGTVPLLRASFEAEYARLYSRSVPDVDIEVLTWVVKVATPAAPPAAASAAQAEPSAARPVGRRPMFDEARGASVEVPVYERAGLPPGAVVEGPAIISEMETTTLVPAAFVARIGADLVIDCVRKSVRS